MVDCKALSVARARGLDGMDTMGKEKSSNLITMEVYFEL